MEVLIGALFLSIWHSILFWKQEIGISAVLFAIPVIYTTMRLLKGKIKNEKALLISIPILLLSSTYFIFDNPLFRILNLIVISAIYITMIIVATSTSSMKSMLSKVILIVIEPLNYFGEIFEEIKNQFMKKFNIQKKEKEPKDKQDIFKAIFFTIIIVLLVLSLLTSADKEFSNLFTNLIQRIQDVSVPELVIRIGVIILLFFYISSFFINILSSFNILKEYEEKDKQPKENLTIYMMLTTLNIIYLIFCYVQIKSLLTIENIKYSSYARQGFFQLMIVSIINIKMILKATDKNLIETDKQQKYKKIMCIIMIIFTLIIIISSFVRMSLYQQNYGDTRLRVLVNFTLITEIILLIPTVIYIIKSKINLAKSYFIIIVTMYCIVNFVNIDNMIAKNNIDRYIETGKIDINYITYGLNSADTTKQLIRLKETEFKYSKGTKAVEDVERLQTYLLNRLSDKINKETTLPEFNLSRFISNIILGGKL